MNSKYKTMILESFANLQSLTPEKLAELTSEAIAYLRTMREKLNSNDVEEREYALKESMEVQQILQSQIGRLKEIAQCAPDETLSVHQLPRAAQKQAQEMKDKFKAFRLERKKCKKTRKSS